LYFLSLSIDKEIILKVVVPVERLLYYIYLHIEGWEEMNLIEDRGGSDSGKLLKEEDLKAPLQNRLL
jgi:hypothetical protein